jgi:hypothetical protein
MGRVLRRRDYDALLVFAAVILVDVPDIICFQLVPSIDISHLTVCTVGHISTSVKGEWIV